MSIHLIDVGHGRNADFLLVLQQRVVVCDMCYFFFFSFLYDHSNHTKPTITVRDRHPILLAHTDVH